MAERILFFWLILIWVIFELKMKSCNLQTLKTVIHLLLSWVVIFSVYQILSPFMTFIVNISLTTIPSNTSIVHSHAPGRISSKWHVNKLLHKKGQISSKYCTTDELYLKKKVILTHHLN